MLLDVTVMNPKEVIFEGKARSIRLPGEAGVFEILSFHKRLISRLISGTMVIDKQTIPIRRGIVKTEFNRVTIIFEE